MMPATSAAPMAKPLVKIENILFPTDFSPCAQAALPYACTLAEQNHATLHLINIVGSPLPTGPLGVPYMEPATEEDVAHRELEHLAESSMVKTVRHDTSIHRGPVWEVVCRFANEHMGDLIVMGTHGRRGVRQLVLGSVAEQVFRRAEHPVLTVGPGAPKNGPANGRFATILVALDLSQESSKLVEWGHLLALSNQSRLIFFHAVEEDSQAEFTSSEYIEDAIRTAKRKMTALAPADIPWKDTVIKIGYPADTILQTALDRNVDLIIVGARRGKTLAAHAPWACAHEVVCAAHCPVLTVRH